MLRTYFFIPASKSRFIEKMQTIESDEIVFDFEDAVADTENEIAIENVKKVTNRQKYWVRPQLFSSKHSEINTTQLEVLIELGFKKYFLPKIITPQQLQNTYNVFEYYDTTDIQCILLIENPLALINIPHFFDDPKIPIKGLALGAQDYAAKINMKYSSQQIEWARKTVLNAACAYNVEAIDISSMIISNAEEFKNEALEGFEMGYTAKMIVHPTQLEAIKNIEYFTPQEIEQAKKIEQQIDFSQLNNFSVVVIDGKLYEKAHLKRISRILDYSKNKKQEQ